NADIDARLTTLAPPAAVDALRAPYRPTVRRYGPVRLSATEASNPSGFDSSRPPGKFAPALLTRTSSWLKLPTNASTESRSVIRSWWYPMPDRWASYPAAAGLGGGVCHGP